MDYKKFYNELKAQKEQALKDKFVYACSDYDKDLLFSEFRYKLFKDYYASYKSLVEEFNELNTEIMDLFSERKFKFKTKDEFEIVNKLFNNYIKEIIIKQNDCADLSEYLIKLFTIDININLSNKFHNSSEYLELVRETNKYENYRVDNDKKILLSSKQYAEMYKLVHNKKWRYPTVENGNKKKDIECGNKKIVSEFDDDEKLYLRHVLYNFIENKLVDDLDIKYKFQKLTLKDFTKIISLCGSLDLETRFTKKQGVDLTYDKVRKGLDYYSSERKRKELVRNVKQKLNELNINSLDDYIIV